MASVPLESHHPTEIKGLISREAPIMVILGLHSEQPRSFSRMQVLHPILYASMPQGREYILGLLGEYNWEVGVQVIHNKASPTLLSP